MLVGVPSRSKRCSRDVAFRRAIDLSHTDSDPPPVPPVRPAAEDCCNGGCVRCVFDLYEDAMDRYRIELEAWRARRKPENTGDSQ